jgi:hypothetical protein
MTITWQQPTRTKDGSREFMSDCDQYRITETLYRPANRRFSAFALDRSWNGTRFDIVWGALSDHRTLEAAQAECKRFARELAKREAGRATSLLTAANKSKA